MSKKLPITKPALRLYRDPNQMLIQGVGPGVGIKFIQEYFPKAKSKLRIASAYFRLEGYKKIKDYINKGVEIHVVVGKEQGYFVRQAVIDEILESLELIDDNLWDVVDEVIELLQQRRLIIKDAREMKAEFHCKFYICDELLFFHGSANLSNKGYFISSEQLSLVTQPKQVLHFIAWYDEVAQHAKDLMQDLIDRLILWRNGVSPFDIYIKTLEILNPEPETYSYKGEYPPTYYQKAVISNALHQLNIYKGSIIVAATGLGKTIIGAEIAMRMSWTGKIKQVIVIGPSGISSEWKKQLVDRGVIHSYYDPSILFKKATEVSYHQVTELDVALLEADSYTLIIIDEAHVYKNQLLNESLEDKISLVINRIDQAYSQGVQVCLLTATAYGTANHNLNSLLRLLYEKPSETHPQNLLTPDQFAMHKKVTILGLPHVIKMAKDRGDVDDNGRVYFQFGSEKRYLPKKLNIHSVEYNIFFEKEFKQAFDGNAFHLKTTNEHSTFEENTFELQKGRSNSTYNASIASWLSSPLAIFYTIADNLLSLGKGDKKQELLNVLKQNKSLGFSGFFLVDGLVTFNKRIDFDKSGTPYKSQMLLSLQNRMKRFNTLIEMFKEFRYNDDHKLVKLIDIIQERCINQKGKVLIFVTRYPTAAYLQNLLSERFQESLKVGSTVKVSRNGLQLLSSKSRAEMLRLFSPKSNKYSTTKREYDVMICTDADGVGKNLQDANAVVNYDFASGADILFQRVGRVLRMTNNPDRELYIYTFVPSLIKSNDSVSRVHERVNKLIDRVTKRHDNSRSILGSTVFTKESSKEVFLDNEADVENLSRDSAMLSDSHTVPNKHMLNHYEVSNNYRREAACLIDYLQSAKYYEEDVKRIFMVIKCQNQGKLLIYNLSSDKFEKHRDLKILNWIACDKDELKAPAMMDQLEKYVNRILKIWCVENNVVSDDVKKICSMYLIPSNKNLTIRELLDKV
jgi:hypothetical protein